MSKVLDSMSYGDSGLVKIGEDWHAFDFIGFSTSGRKANVVVWRDGVPEEDWLYWAEHEWKAIEDEPALTDENGDEPMIADEDDGWIEWDGGECPVSPELMIEVKFQCGETSSDPAGTWGWHKDKGAKGDYLICAYRITDMGSNGLPANTGESEVGGGHVPAVNAEIKTASAAASQVAHHFLVPPREQARLPDISYLDQPRLHRVAIDPVAKMDFSPSAFWSM